MEDLKRMAVFAAVVQAGSMTAAARQLGMTPSAVSQHIRQLERQAGVTLLHRSTRQIALSDAGQRFYVQCATLADA
ncbi:LysR family transcriptional regulator, partial [Comamonas aquatica]